MNKTLSIVILLTAILGCAMTVQTFGGAICGNCGNSQLQMSLQEKCDDGNTADGDGCNSQCQIQTGYTCTSSMIGSLCTLISVTPSCGNNVRNNDEECDDGNNQSGDGCTSNCFIEPGHVCNDPSPSQPDQCTFSDVSICGNGIIEEGNSQTCDDGNTVSGDGCGQHCIVQTHYVCVTEGDSISTCVTTSVCGNFIKQANEQCDNGLGAGCQDCTLNPEYYCTVNSFCSESICYHIPVCGDGIKEGGQQCDAGPSSIACVDCKIVSGFNCVENAQNFSVCAPNIQCGNNLVQTGEQCDNGNNIGCSQNCIIDPSFSCQVDQSGGSICYQCGNNIVQFQQKCDNGNNPGCTNCQVDSGFYCSTQSNGSSLCVVSFCGNGIREPLEECDNGNKQGCFSCQIVDGYQCFEDSQNASVCVLKSCGDGIKQEPEQCDNFNALGCFNCKIGEGFDCIENSMNMSTCTLKPICGNGGKQVGEQCDNGNRLGCSVNCTIDEGFSCVENILGYSVCTRDPFCGDGIRNLPEQQCDNAGAAGCTSACKIISGFICVQNQFQNSVCRPTVCGDRLIQGNQQCDNGNQTGCIGCTVDQGYLCNSSSSGSVCELLPICGDSIRQPRFQQCDNGNQTGCIGCTVDTNYTCNENMNGNSFCYLAQCGNRIKQDLEQCDNGNRFGCFGCTIDEGFNCVVNTAGASVCTLKSQCGNNAREGDQQCDNGNQTGCIGCTVDFGYECFEGTRNNSVCTQTTCGDRIKQQGQQCDNGRQQGCRDCRIADGYSCVQNAMNFSTCSLSSNCGNNIVQIGQECDNGNQTGCTDCTRDPGYACSNNICTPIPAQCNNFVREIGQECDNGGFFGCTQNCTVTEGFTCVGGFEVTSTCNKKAACGDNALQTNLLEQCDDGNTMDDDGCSSKCQQQWGWTCPSRGNGRPTICFRRIEDGCGNGIIDSSVQKCDDNNNINGDGCSRYCLIEEGFTCQVQQNRSICVLTTIPEGCGDSKVDPSNGQECDDNNHLSFDGCSSACKIQWGWQCSQVSPSFYSICSKRCGNGYYQPNYNQQCDDGNSFNHDGCNGLCMIEEGYHCPRNQIGQRSQCFKKPPTACGNGKVEDGEQCDDGFAHSGDGCSAQCKVQSGWQCGGNPSHCIHKPVCGNGAVQTGQFCDDGNMHNGDGCSHNCRVQSDWKCYSITPGGISTCQRKTHPKCGNGIREYGEECDDGNNNQYDGCHNCKYVHYPPPPPPPQQFCGDYIYQPNRGQFCDNGNQAGCINCHIDSRYHCINKIGSASVCYLKPVPPPPHVEQCGNGKYEPNNNQYCDDGNKDNGDGCSRTCRKENGYICANELNSLSYCYEPYVCQYSNYPVPYVKLCPEALQALKGTSLQSAVTVLDIIKALIDYNSHTAVIRQRVLKQMDDLIYHADSTEWDVIAYNINACTGYTSL